VLVGTIHGRVSQNPQILLSAVSGRNVCSFYCCSTDTANLAASDHSDIAQGGETLSSEGSWPSSFYLKETHVNDESAVSSGVIAYRFDTVQCVRAATVYKNVKII
jgi:hypothetical protein